MSGSRQATPGDKAAPSLRERLVATAVAGIERDGLTVSLEHLGLERIIAASGVSRASAYRLFPAKADFLREVLLAVVGGTRLEEESPVPAEALAALLARDADRLTTPEGRRDVVVEGLRLTSEADVARLSASVRWSTYLALHATAQGVADAGLREELVGALAAAEAAFTVERAAFFADLADLLGYRLRPPLVAPEGFVGLADAAGALMTGLVVRRSTGPDERFRTAPFGSSQESEWTWPAHHLVGLLLAHLEPDPAVVWDSERIAGVGERLAALLDSVGP